MSKLAERCFTDDEIDSIDDLSDSVLKYLFQCDVYGSHENRIAVDRAKTGNFVLYALKRLFLPYRSMAITYPVLKRHRIFFRSFGAFGTSIQKNKNRYKFRLTFLSV